MKKCDVIKMGYVIQNYLEKNNLKDQKPKDLMELLISKSFVTKDRKEGLPLREVLRDLDKTDELYLLPQVHIERKISNRYWYFSPIKID